MFGREIRLFKLFGFSVGIDWSWLIIALLITWSLAAGLFPRHFPELDQATYWWMGIAGALGLFVSIILHEFAHALMARRYGVEMRGITLFVFGGVAQMKSEPRSPEAEFMIAVAGPIMSVVVGGVCLALGATARAAAWPGPAYGVLFYLGFINLLLVAFNLIPAFPLDGGRMLRAGLWKLKGSLRWATRITSGIGSAFGILLIVVGVFSFINGFVIAGMWWFLLGMFLNSAAQMSYQQLLMRRILEGEPVHRLMHSDVITVSPQTRVDEFVQNYVYRHHHKLFPVATNGDLQGCMTTQRLKDLSRDQWPQHTVSELAEPCSGENTISADADSMEAFTRMTQDGRSRLIVVDQGRLQGVLTLKDLMRHISLKMELEP